MVLAVYKAGGEKMKNKTLTTVLSLTLILAGHLFSLPAPALEIEFSTYFGGSENDYGMGIAVDADKSVYLTGYTFSLNFPTENPYRPDRAGNFDAFITKFSSTGSSLIYSTYLGGSDLDRGLSIAADSAYAAYIVGVTSSIDFPTQNPYQASNAGDYDAFLVKLSSAGTSLLYSTYLGGSDRECGAAFWEKGKIVLDTSSCAYVAGCTWSADFPTQNPYQADYKGGDSNGGDAFVAKFSSSGSSLLYSTYLGGVGGDRGNDLEIDATQSVYLAGTTGSADFPTLGPYQTSYAGGNLDSFISKLSPSGSSLLYSTYLGGDLDDYCWAITVDTADNAYLTGYSWSTDFPTVNPYRSSGNPFGEIAFAAKLSSTGSTLTYSTFLDSDHGFGIAVDPSGCAYIGSDNTNDIIIDKLSSSGSSLLYSEVLGGSSYEHLNGLVLESTDLIYVTGNTDSSDFPTVNPYQPFYGGGLYDAFVTKLVPPPSPTPEGFKTPTTTPTPEFIPTTTLTPTPPIPIPTETPTSTPSPTPPPIATPTLTSSPTPTPSVPPMPTPSCPCGTGTPTPMPAQAVIDSGDYDGDGSSDIAIFRGSSGMWSVRGVTRVYYGSSSDIPVSGDYSGDGTTDIGIFRETFGLWAVRGVTRAYYGSSSDIPIPGDYDGDGSCDVGIFRNSNGLWAIAGVTRVYFGSSGDTAVPGDYDGDGIKDIALFRDSSGLWAIQGQPRVYYGSLSDSVVPGDYNGDGTWKTGIFRPSTGMWGIRGVTRVYYGSPIDQPVPADYNGDSVDDIGIYRGSSGLWDIWNISRAYFGGSGDIPVTR